MKTNLTIIRRWFLEPSTFILATLILWLVLSIGITLLVISSGASPVLGIVLFVVWSVFFFVLMTMNAISLYNNLERIESVDVLVESLGGPEAVHRILKFLARHSAIYGKDYAKIRDAFVSFVTHHINRTKHVASPEPEVYLRPQTQTQ